MDLFVPFDWADTNKVVDIVEGGSPVHEVSSPDMVLLFPRARAPPNIGDLSGGRTVERGGLPKSERDLHGAHDSVDRGATHGEAASSTSAMAARSNVAGQDGDPPPSRRH